VRRGQRQAGARQKRPQPRNHATAGAEARGGGTPSWAALLAAAAVCVRA